MGVDRHFHHGVGVFVASADFARLEFVVLSTDHPVRPIEEERSIFFGYTDDFGDGNKGQFGRNFSNEVTFTSWCHAIEDCGGSFTKAFLETADHPRCKSGIHEFAIASVLGRVS